MGCVLAHDEGCLHLLTDLRLVSVQVHGLQLLWSTSLRDVQGVHLVPDTNSLLLNLAVAHPNTSGPSAAMAVDVKAVMCANAAAMHSMYALLTEGLAL